MSHKSQIDKKRPSQDPRSKLYQSEQRLRDIAEVASDWFWETDSDLRFTYISDRFYGISSVSPKEVIGKTRLEFVSDHERKANPEKWEGHEDDLLNRRPFRNIEYQVHSPDGKPCYIQISGKPFFSQEGIFLGYRGAGSDITAQKVAEKALQDAKIDLENQVSIRTAKLRQEIAERKQAEEAIKRSDSMQSKMFANIGDVIVIIDQDGINRYKSPNIEKLFGWKPEDVVGASTWENVHPEDLESTQKFFGTLMQEPDSVGTTECRYKCKDGSYRWIELTGSNLLHDPEIRGILGNYHDITDRKQADEALRESEEKFRTLVEKSPLGISLIGNDGHYRYVNPKFTNIFGYTLEDIPTGKKWFQKAYPDESYRRKVMEAWIKELQQTETGKDRPQVYTVTCKDGLLKDIHFRPVTMENLDQFVVYEDITERSRMERQLLQTQKFEAIGTLAGGIAHDFNNLLMGIQGRASLMAADLEPFHSYLEHTNAIEDYIRSATDLTKQLLGLARDGKYEVKPTNINDLVRNSAKMFGRTKKEIQIHTNFPDPPPVVMVDRNQIEQVLLNLYINAWQAMPGGGELYLETQIVTLDDAGCKPYQAKAGNYAKVSVTDTGIGMDETTRQQVFDPFFTTKKKSRGTGLGLASAYGIIKNHDGIIRVHSEVGHGTTFNIYFPLSDKEAYREGPMEGRLLKGSETVLLVDDEEMILEVGQAMLEKLGYRIVVANGGEQAVDAVIRKGDEIDLVILDLIMPGMDGGKVFERIKEIRPQLPVMLSSGYAINGQADEIMQKGCNGFIQKPFNLSELSLIVRKVLDKVKN